MTRFNCAQAPNTDWVEVDTYEHVVWVTLAHNDKEPFVALIPADARAMAAELIAAADEVDPSWKHRWPARDLIAFVGLIAFILAVAVIRFQWERAIRAPPAVVTEPAAPRPTVTEPAR